MKTTAIRARAAEALQPLTAGEATILAALADLREEVAALRATLNGRQADDAALLAEIAALVTDGETFTASHLVDISTQDEDLRIAIAAVAGSGRHTARRLGKALERLRDQVCGPYRVRRFGAGRDGALWTIEAV